MSQNNKVQKLNNDSYKITVLIEPADLDLETTNEEITGQFEVEVFQKNFGTFEEDSQDVHNIDCVEIKKDGLIKDFNNDFNFLERNQIRKYVLECAESLLKTHLNGQD